MNSSRGFHFHSARRRYGFSLVELLVALVITLFLLAGMIQLVIGNRQVYRFQNAISRIQENGRFALEVLSRDVRTTGYTGCPPTNIVINVLNNPTDWWKNFGPGSLVGYEGTQNTFPGRVFGTGPGDRINGTDAAVFLGSSGGYFITATAPAAVPPTFTLNQLGKPDGGSLGIGDIAIVCDTNRTSIFQVTGVNAGPPITIGHAAGVLTPGNSTANLFPLGVPDSYVPNESTLVDFAPSAFYVGVSNSGDSRSLYRLQLQVTGAGAASMVTQELVEGVVDMQIFYGEDTNSDRVIDQYVDASAVAVADWPNILSVRVNLLLTSLDNNIVSQPQTVFFPADTGSSAVVGGSFTASDRRLYQIFSTTIGIRNRLP
ncbi:MAG: PilW family protein [Candidatus Competibacteraceae bacterium]|nr:PilW family protein [Candidatus Competibacteraceae bacterium]